MARKKQPFVECSHPGCHLMTGPLGYCAKHVTMHIDEAFRSASESGLVDLITPPCFGFAHNYYEYVVLYITSAWSAGHKSRRFVDYCKDCDPEFQKSMAKAGKCTHPEVVFYRDATSSGEVTGVSCADPKRWESAIIGSHGGVVRVPPEDVVAWMFNKLAGGD